jgi:hypothetical protein
MSTITVDQANVLEKNTALRIKFAGINDFGDRTHDANFEEYDEFFSESDLPAGWSVDKVGEIDTRTAALRPAWQFSNGQIELVAVEHETGLELLLIGVVAPLVYPDVRKLVVWGWKRWGGLRKGKQFKVDSSLEIEVPRVNSAGITSGPPIRLILPPPVSDDDIARYLQIALDSGQAG